MLVDSITARGWIDREEDIDDRILGVLDVVAERLIRDLLVHAPLAGALRTEAREVQRLLDRSVGPRREQMLGIPYVP
ncbi:MAG: hypothetical protein IT372_22485 [Polyangiaceae bacterium]|nr:hypothetical protein [Polyangiaceae bacterium]